MRAIVQRRYGSPSMLRLEEIERPVAGEGEVLVRVRAASVNAADWHIVTGSPFVMRFVVGLRHPKSPVPGIDVAGEVEAVGRGVTRLRPGDAVYGTCDGAFAEYARVAEDRAAPKPANLTFEQAAAVPPRCGDRPPGPSRHRSLPVGPEGAGHRRVGGRRDIRRADRQGARGAGGRRVPCRQRRDGPVARRRSRHRLHAGGRDPRGGAIRRHPPARWDALALRAPSRPRPEGDARPEQRGGAGRFAGIDRIVRALLVSPFVGQRLTTFNAKASSADLAFLTGLIESGKITPVIDRLLPLSQAPTAIRYLQTGRTRGKVVLTV